MKRGFLDAAGNQITNHGTSRKIQNKQLAYGMDDLAYEAESLLWHTTTAKKCPECAHMLCKD